MAAPIPPLIFAKSGPVDLTPPNISLEFAFSPEIYSLSQDTNVPVLSITITSHATQPITLFTWGTYLHPHWALSNMLYSIIDVDTQKRIYVPIEHVRRNAFVRRLGHPDEAFFWTLYPGEARVVTQPFHFVSLWRRRNEQAAASGLTSRESWVYQGVEMRCLLEPGHRYTLNCPKAGFKWWRWGTTEENLEPKGARENCGLGWSEPYFVIPDIKEARLEIRE